MSNLFNISNEAVINFYGNSDQYQPASARWGGSTNGHVVVWASNGQDGSSTGIYARRFAWDDTPLGTEFLLA